MELRSSYMLNKVQQSVATLHVFFHEKPEEKEKKGSAVREEEGGRIGQQVDR